VVFLIESSSANLDPRIGTEAQKILANDLPAFNLWYLDTVVVHNRRLTDVVPAPSRSYAFLETVQLAQSSRGSCQLEV